MSPFVLQLRWLMETKGVRQKQIADDIGVSQAQVSRWLDGARDPSIDTLQKAARVFGVPLGDLIEKPDGAVHESIARYGSNQQSAEWMEKLKRHWHHKGAPQDHMRVAIALLWPDHAAKIIAWLEENK